MNRIFLEDKLKEFLREDLWNVEVQSGSVVAAEIVAETTGVFCGGRIIPLVFDLLHPEGNKTEIVYVRKEGEKFKAGDVLAQFHVDGEVLRHGIRTVLNLLERMISIATHTSNLVSRLSNYPAELLDTRKTTPGLRAFEKYAVKVGGAKNHRFGRYDGILIKKEDIALSGGIKNAIDEVLSEKSHLVQVEVEVETLDELSEAIEDGRVKYILLDNMDVSTMEKAVEKCGDEYILEASGIKVIDLEMVAATGVHYISTSSLVLSAPRAKIKMRVV